jgi:polyisoprenoid-binding protein YceI
MTTTSATVLAAGRWTVDPGRSRATFRVGNLGRTVTGTVPIIDGTIEVGAGGRPTAISGSLDLGAIDTGNTRRDKDLRGPRFLDLDDHPTMTFTASEIIATPAGWRISGQLAVRGTRVQLTGEAEVSRPGGPLAVTARTQLDRRALGIRVPAVMIGRTIGITVSALLDPATRPVAPGRPGSP